MNDIADIALRAGFYDQAHFRKVFKKAKIIREKVYKKCGSFLFETLGIISFQEYKGGILPKGVNVVYCINRTNPIGRKGVKP